MSKQKQIAKKKLLQQKQEGIKKLQKMNEKLDLVEDKLKEIKLNDDLKNIS